jgi:hypothetical protein
LAEAAGRGEAKVGCGQQTIIQGYRAKGDNGGQGGPKGAIFRRVTANNEMEFGAVAVGLLQPIAGSADVGWCFKKIPPSKKTAVDSLTNMYNHDLVPPGPQRTQDAAGFSSLKSGELEKSAHGSGMFLAQISRAVGGPPKNQPLVSPQQIEASLQIHLQAIWLVAETKEEVVSFPAINEPSGASDASPERTGKPLGQAAAFARRKPIAGVFLLAGKNLLVGKKRVVPDPESVFAGGRYQMGINQQPGFQFGRVVGKPNLPTTPGVGIGGWGRS